MTAREKATRAEDLPHPFERGSKSLCKLCKLDEGDQRHVAWEQNKEMAAEYPTVERERGA